MTTINELRATEAGVVAELAALAAEPKELAAGEIVALLNDAGGYTIHDLEKYDDRPRRVEATRTVGDAASFCLYMANHGGIKSEVWADTPRSSVVGIIDAHELHDEPEWESHKVKLVLDKSIAWSEWEKYNEQWLAPLDFAEFIELRALDVREPSTASLLDLAQHFTAHRTVAYERGERIKDGETNLHFKETITAKAGSKNDVVIPDQIKLALRPYVGGPMYYVWARFRYRLNGAELVLGYVLERPQEILDLAFSDIVDEIRNGKPQTASKDATDTTPSVIASPGHPGVSQPIYYGRP